MGEDDDDDEAEEAEEEREGGSSSAFKKAVNARFHASVTAKTNRIFSSFSFLASRCAAATEGGSGEGTPTALRFFSCGGGGGSAVGGVVGLVVWRWGSAIFMTTPSPSTSPILLNAACVVVLRSVVSFGEGFEGGIGGEGSEAKGVGIASVV